MKRSGSRTYAEMIAAEVFDAGWGVETDKRGPQCVVRAYDDKGTQCVAVAETWLGAWLEVKKLCAETRHS